MMTGGKNGSSHNSLPLSRNGLKETRYLTMKLRKALNIYGKEKLLNAKQQTSKEVCLL